MSQYRSKPSIKYCGLTRPEDVETALMVGADYLGFIVECQSPRRLSVTEAARLARPATGLAKRVAVTVNPDDKLIGEIITEMQPDYIQLHGDESSARLNEIKKKHAVGLIKAVSISDKHDLDRAKSYSGIADYLLLDAKPPKGDKQRGGHDLSFDWSLLQKFNPTTPLIIAGGLSAATIGLARQKSKAQIFDVSSGIEAAPGIKDATLMTQFMKAARHE
jgi:phosphoribosylanthranilate isomerase